MAREAAAPTGVMATAAARGKSTWSGEHSTARGGRWKGESAESASVSRDAAPNHFALARNDSIGGFVLCHSLAGGTGSGLGTRLSEELRERFGVRLLLNCSVSPHRHGESPMQAYNATLCLAHLLE